MYDGGERVEMDISESEDDRLLAEFAAAAEDMESDTGTPGQAHDYALATEWAESAADDDAASDTESWSKSGEATWSIEARRPELTQVRAYETALLAALEQALRTIRVRIAGYDVPAPPVPFPPPSAKSAALSELIEVTAAGELHAEEAQARKARLLAIAEASARLRSLIELYDAGRLTVEELARKRSEVTAELSQLIVPAPA
jgi:hypothetical protein